jgi:Rps23 Pro-64 3,4-dihydroxylase Tpa1-like proline 4-hydroxylase
MINPSADNIFVIDNFFSEEEVDNALKIIRSHELTEWSENSALLVVPKKYMDAFSLVTNSMYNVSKVIAEKFNLSNSLYAVEGNIGRWALNKDLEIHDDTYDARFTKYSSVIYLTSSYEGGELEFPDFNLSLKPKAGQLVIFPAGGHWHKVNPVTSGDRSTIVGFYTDVDPEKWYLYYGENNEYGK